MERPRLIEPARKPHEPLGCGCGFGEFIVILLLIGIFSVIAMFTLGGAIRF